VKVSSITPLSIPQPAFFRSLLGLKRPTLIYRMKKLGIDRSLRACSAESSRVGLSGCPRGGVLNGALQRSYTDPFDRTSPPIPIGPHTDKAGPMTSAPRR
jgi:hypothetical protein